MGIWGDVNYRSGRQDGWGDVAVESRDTIQLHLTLPPPLCRTILSI